MDSSNLPNQNAVNQTPTKRVPFRRRRSFWLIILGILILLMLIKYFHSGKKIKKTPAAPVVVATAQTTNVPVYLNELGAVTPTYTITVKTQINGQLWRVLYKEGQLVKKGQLIAEIDPRPFQAQLVQAEGQLIHDKALLANALIDLKRYQTLWRQNSVAKQVLDTQLALVNQDIGTVKADEGLIQTIKVNLIYCEITSPVDGRIGLRLVDPGNFVQTSDTTGLAVIATLNPITVIFSIPEDNIPEVLEQLNNGTPLTVKAYNREQSKVLATGKLLTIDNEVDPTTGSVKLRAQFDNPNNALFPSQFVNAQLLVKTLPNVTVVPTAAIQHGANSDFVYAINDNKTTTNKKATGKTVTIINIVAGITDGDNTVIKSGIAPGQVVVVEGADKLTDGAHVTISQANPPVPTVNSTQGLTTA